MEIIIWAIGGIILGLLASFIIPNSGGSSLNALIGGLGAVIGGGITSIFTKNNSNPIDWFVFTVAMLGALVLVGLTKMVRS